MTHAAPPPPDAYSWQVSEETLHEERVADASARRRSESERSGWMAFAAAMMSMAGVFQGVNGLAAIFRSGTYVADSDQMIVHVDFTVWGWVHLILGLIAIAAAFGLLAGHLWARVVGIALAVISAMVNLVFIPATPFGATLVIFLDVLVIYAIVVHGEAIEDSGY